MSSSSSTMRSSGAISDPFFIPLTHFLFTYSFLFQWEHQAHFRARFVVLAVAERDLASVLLDDLAHDSKAKPGALRACGHIGLGQTMAFCMRESDAIVRQREHHTGGIGTEVNHNPAPLLRAFGNPRLDGLAGVLQHVDERLRN